MRTLIGLVVAGALMLGAGLSEAEAAPGHKKISHRKYSKKYSKKYAKKHSKKKVGHKKYHKGLLPHRKYHTGLLPKKHYKRPHRRIVRRTSYHRPRHHTVIYAGLIFRPNTVHTSTVVYASPVTSVPVATSMIDPLVAGYMAALSSPSEGEREHAAKALGELRDPAAVEHLIGSMLYDTDDDVREEAAEALGKIADARAIQPLQHAAVYDTDSDVRRNAIRSLAIFGA
jgi:HEAT repeat protein